MLTSNGLKSTPFPMECLNSQFSFFSYFRDETCIYHMISRATISYLQALLTYEQVLRPGSHLQSQNKKQV